MVQSLLALHSLGLYHGDPDERNVAIRREDADDTYRYFDFGNCHWHWCPGITDCEELRCQVRIIYNFQPPPWDPKELQERTVREYGLPFCNLKAILGGTESFKYEPAILRLKRQANRYEAEFSRFESQ